MDIEHITPDCLCEGKRCTTCEKLQCISQYNKDKRLRSGLQSRCRICMKAQNTEWRQDNQEYNQQRVRDYYATHKEQRRAYYVARHYNLSIEQWDVLYHAQGGCCALCRVDLNSLPAKSVHVDHCHATNKVRGILCSGCNTSLGKLGDTPESIMRVYYYLIGV